MRFSLFTMLFIGVLSIMACGNVESQNNKLQKDDNADYAVSESDLKIQDTEAVLTLAGGCFWCTEGVYERINGVTRVYSGYSGGTEKSPKYRQVAMGNTSHAEAIQVYYKPSIISLEKLLEVFFTAAHDPTQLNRQGPDRGPQYRSIAFYRNTDEKQLIENQIKSINDSGKFSDPIVTDVKKFEKFWPAEDYHQDYMERHPDDVPYVNSVSKPKVNKFEKMYPELLKEEYK